MKLKKLLALLMALIMCVCVFAACEVNVTGDVDKDDDEKTEETQKDKDEKKDKEDKKDSKKEDYVPEKLSDEEEIEDAVTKFFELALTGDDAALDYVAEESQDDAAEAIDEMAILKDDLLSEFGMDELAEEMPEEVVTVVEDFADDVYDVIMSSVDISVDNIEVDGDEATVTATLTIIDVEGLEDLDMDFDKYEEEMMDAVLDKYSEDELANMSEAEAMEVLAEILPDIMKDIFKEVLAEIEDAATSSESTDFTVIKEDGEWKIKG